MITEVFIPNTSFESFETILRIYFFILSFFFLVGGEGSCCPALCASTMRPEDAVKVIFDQINPREFRIGYNGTTLWCANEIGRLA